MLQHQRWKISEVLIHTCRFILTGRTGDAAEALIYQLPALLLCHYGLIEQDIVPPLLYIYKELLNNVFTIG